MASFVTVMWIILPSPPLSVKPLRPDSRPPKRMMLEVERLHSVCLRSST